MWLRDLVDFEAKKVILPVILVVVFFFAELLRSPYGPRFMDGAGYYAGTTVGAMYAAYAGFVGFLRPGLVYTTPIDDAFFVVVLLFGGYLLSSGVIFLHRHNRTIYYRGKKMFIVVFAFMAASFMTLNTRYLLLDARIVLFITFVMGYLLTSFVWGLYDLLKTHEAIKKIKKQKTLAKYFRWEFKYLK
ncbi:MAG TPA: hypothetical protein VJI12_02040 [archaeon]|nr:hypothetical protein [archaeon]